MIDYYKIKDEQKSVLNNNPLTLYCSECVRYKNEYAAGYIVCKDLDKNTNGNGNGSVILQTRNGISSVYENFEIPKNCNYYLEKILKNEQYS